MLKAILNYQEIDKQLYKLERELAACDERKEYVKVKKFLETAPEKLDALEVKAKSLRAEADELVKQYERAEDTLKEFEHLDELVDGGADIAFYKKKAQTIVDVLKKLKADLTALMNNIKATDAEFQKMKKQVLAVEKQAPEVAQKYKAVKASKDAERKEIEEKLETLAKDVSAELMAVYQTKRKEKIFPVVGQLNAGRCPFCSMEPPLAARNKLSGGGTLECDNCHRLIFEK